MTRSNTTIVSLGDYIEELDIRNNDLRWGLDSVRGVSNTKLIQRTKANLEGRDLSPFHVVGHNEFVFNRRTTRNGEKIGLGFNDTEHTFIFTEDYVHFRVKDETILSPEYLYIFFLRDEFDREVRFNSWGSATEFFNWEDMCRISIPLPSIQIQHNVVNAWKALHEIHEQNKSLSNTLLQVCSSFLQEMKHNYRSDYLGKHICRCNEKNKGNIIKDVFGVSTIRSFIPASSSVDTSNLSGYKVVHPKDLAYVPTTHMKVYAIAISNQNFPFVISPIYEVFRVSSSELLPEFVFLFLNLKESERYAFYNSWGSARENYTFDKLERIKIPIPPIEIQQAIVNIYSCSCESKYLSDTSYSKSREICPALIQYAINN